MYNYNAEIIGVHDGDTLTMNVDLGLETHRVLIVRLFGINAPELATPEGVLSLKAVLNLVNINGPFVQINTIKDHREKYGRYLATVTLKDGTVLNTWLVANNFAVVYKIN